MVRKLVTFVLMAVVMFAVMRAARADDVVIRVRGQEQPKRPGLFSRLFGKPQPAPAAGVPVMLAVPVQVQPQEAKPAATMQAVPVPVPSVAPPKAAGMLKITIEKPHQ